MRIHARRVRDTHRFRFFGRLALASAALVSVVGCSGLRLQLINSSVRRPSNIALYFTVDKSNGDPVPGLTAESFQIFEDDRPVSQLEAHQTILNPQVSAVHYTLLLMDMSGSVTQSGQVPALQAAAQAFIQRVERQQRVAVYAFDGSVHVSPIVPFTSSAGSAASGVAGLSSFHSRDPSTNLNGAVVESLAILHRALEATTQPLKFGTLVVFTDGSDRAQRTTHQDMMEAVRASPYDIFAIGVGAEIDSSELHDIGRRGTVVEPAGTAVQTAFEQIAQRIEGYTQRYYLLSYCSPARAGQHRLRVEAATADGASGSVTHEFDAAGFGPNCDPNTPPAFDTSLRSRARGGEVGQPGH